MRAFQRLVQTVSVSVESLLDQVENQRAVAAATVRDVEQGAARVRSYRRSAERRIAELEQRKAALEAEIESWRERARRMQSDRPKALECMRRLRAATLARDSVERELDEQRGLLGSIEREQRAIDGKLGELRRRLALLSSREARTEADRAASGLSDTDGIFDRWEARLEQHESLSEVRAAPVDAFARGLDEEESEALLEAELERVLAEDH